MSNINESQENKDDEMNSNDAYDCTSISLLHCIVSWDPWGIPEVHILGKCALYSI